MKRTLRTGMAIVLVGLFAAPLSAQQATLRLPPPEHAQKGDQVVVTLRDGREIAGDVGSWVDDVGFYVKPSHSPAWLIHPEDVVAIRGAASGRTLDLPLRKAPSKISTANAVFIGVASTLGALFLIAHFVPRT
jgi:hypothetical protein